MIRKVLIVSPHFPPVNAADHQRVRMSLPYFEEFGWEPTVLAVRPECVEAVADSNLEKTIPHNQRVVCTKALPIRWTRRIGLGGLALRSMSYLWGAGNRLFDNSHRLSGRAFDLVFFSTTQFPVMILGPIWRKRFGIPYVTDFQDPWLDDYYETTGTMPPGGRLKHGLSRWLARWLEPKVMRHVSEVISVSPAYVETFLSRYPFMHPKPIHSAYRSERLERDFDILLSLRIDQASLSRKPMANSIGFT